MTDRYDRYREAIATGVLISLTLPRIDTRVFRKACLYEIDESERAILLLLSHQYLVKHTFYRLFLKEIIDDYEMNSGLYRNNPRYRGSTRKVQRDTLAGLAAAALLTTP